MNTEGPPGLILGAWRRGTFRLIVSEPLLAAYERVFGYPRVSRRLSFPPDKLNEVLDGFRESAEIVVPTGAHAFVRADPSDDADFQCAIAGGADFIVSGDKHVRGLEVVEGIQVVTATTFEMLLRQAR